MYLIPLVYNICNIYKIPRVYSIHNVWKYLNSCISHASFYLFLMLGTFHVRDTSNLFNVEIESFLIAFTYQENLKPSHT